MVKGRERTASEVLITDDNASKTSRVPREAVDERGSAGKKAAREGDGGRGRPRRLGAAAQQEGRRRSIFASKSGTFEEQGATGLTQRALRNLRQSSEVPLVEVLARCPPDDGYLDFPHRAGIGRNS